MAELGALSLKISADGGAAVVSTLKQIDAEAKKTAASATPLGLYFQKAGQQAKAGGQVVTTSLKALNKEIAESTRLFQLHARTVDLTSDVAVRELRASAAAQQEWLRQVNASTIAQARFNAAVQTFEQRAARAGTGMAFFGREVTNTTGKLSAFSTRAITGFNAAAFALSGLASGGQVGFRTLAQSAAGFAAFFGVGGAIASIGITSGLALLDYFQRAKNRIREMREELNKAVADFKKLDDPVGALAPALKLAQADLAAAQRALDERRRQARLALGDQGQKVTDEQLSKFLEKEIAAVTAAADRVTAVRRQQFEAANTLTDRAIEEQQKVDAVFEAIEQKRRQREEEARQRLIERVGQLSALGAAEKLTARELVEAIRLHGEYAAVVRDGTKSLKEREEAATRAAALSKALIPPVPLTPGLGLKQTGIGAAPLQQGIPLDAERIRRQLQSADALSAVRRANIQAFEDARIQDGIADALATSIANGIAVGFARGLSDGGIGEGFKQLGASLLQGFGSIFLDVGTAALKGALQLEAITTFLQALNPVAAIGAATVLIALGSALGGRRSRTVGGGGFAGSLGGGTTTPIAIQRIINDPAAGLRGRRSVLPHAGDVQRIPNPLEGMRFLVVNTPEGDRFMVERTAKGLRRGIGGG